MTNDTVRPPSSQSQGASRTRANVQDVLPLLPNQLALLLHRDRAQSDPGFLQVRYRLEGPLDVERYAQAWRSVMAAHPSLRASMRRRDAGDPLMIIWREVDLPLVVEDWRDEDDPESRFGRLLQSDEVRGLDLTTAPAMRLQLIRTHDEIYEALWTCHHLLVDGWSAAIVLEDVMSRYRDAERSVAPSSPASSEALRSYVTWVADADREHLGSYWSAALSGHAGADPLILGSLSERPGFGDLTEEIPADLASSLSSVAAEINVPVAVLLQAAWMLVLAAATGDDDIVFGTTVSGRNADVPGMERLVGYFSNAVPVRLELDRSSPLSAWLAEFRNRQFEMAQFEHASLADIHRWSDVPGHRAMFETFVVIENFPVGDTAGDDVVQRGFWSGLTSAYPITLAVGMGSPWFVRIRFQRARCTDVAAAAMIDQLMRVMNAIADDHRGAVGDVAERAGDVVSHLVAHPDAGQAGPNAVIKSSRTDTERRLASIWCHHLDLADISIDADYFDLGGTSLGAVGMFRSIKEELGADLPLSVLLTHPTIEGLAQVITGVESGTHLEPVCLVPIQPHGTKPPIAAVHGGGGNVLFYRGLADQLGPDQPLYGLQPVGLDGSDPLDTVPEMAARYIEELRQVQPAGPYRLIGFCFGGTVCLEMAAQLEGQGYEVDFVGIIDGGLPLDAARYRTGYERVRYMMSSRGAFGTAKAASKRIGWRTTEWWNRTVARIRGDERGSSVPVAMACRRAFNTFEPRPSSAPITLIRSEEKQPGEGKDWDFAWDDYTSRLEVRTVHARHQTLFDGASVEALADIIRLAIPD